MIYRYGTQVVIYRWVVIYEDAGIDCRPDKTVRPPNESPIVSSYNTKHGLRVCPVSRGGGGGGDIPTHGGRLVPH